ncbi:MAG: amidohydrolase family protein [Cyanobacteria bacterium J06635_15]
MKQNKISRRAFLGEAKALGTLSLIKSLEDPIRHKSAVENLPKRHEFVLRDAYVITMDPELGDIPHGDIHVRDGEIIAIGKGLSAPKAETIDRRNHIVLPGLIDTHWHLWTALFRSLSGDTADQGYFSITKKLGKVYRPEDMYRATRLAIAEALFSGITTVHDFNHNIRNPNYAKAALSALSETGIRARFSYGYYQGQLRESPTPFDEISSLKQALSNDTDDNLLTLGIAPREVLIYPKYDYDWEKARELELPITVHANSSPRETGEIQRLSRKGLLGKDVLIVHATVATRSEFEQLASNHTAVSITPLTEMRGGFGIPPIRDLLTAGILVSLGIDTTALAGSADMFSVMKVLQSIGNACAESEFALSPRRILELATINGAHAMNIADQVGSLKPGKRADLISVSTANLNLGVFTNPAHLLVEATQPSNVDMVVVDGRILKRDGQLSALNVAQVIQDANNSLASIRQRANK